MTDVTLIGTDADANGQYGFSFEGNNGATLVAAIASRTGTTSPLP